MSERLKKGISMNPVGYSLISFRKILVTGKAFGNSSLFIEPDGLSLFIN